MCDCLTRIHFFSLFPFDITLHLTVFICLLDMISYDFLSSSSTNWFACLREPSTYCFDHLSIIVYIDFSIFSLFIFLLTLSILLHSIHSSFRWDLMMKMMTMMHDDQFVIPYHSHQTFRSLVLYFLLIFICIFHYWFLLLFIGSFRRYNDLLLSNIHDVQN